MFDRFAGTIRRIPSHRSGFDSYLANVQKAGCSSCPRYDEARKDFNSRHRGEVHGYLG